MCYNTKAETAAVIEAKARDKYYTEGVGQAKDYAGNYRFGLYSTNGLQIYPHRYEGRSPGDVLPILLRTNYGTTLSKSSEPNLSLPKHGETNYHFRSIWRPWRNMATNIIRKNAITKVLEAVANDQQRILLTLATGTGKTAIAFQIAWKLFPGKMDGSTSRPSTEKLQEFYS